MSPTDPREAELAALLPPSVAVCLSTQLPASAALLEPEQAATAGMVERRLAEYLHGRHCARSAMRQLGLAPQAIIKQPDRSPRWPADVIGSITHARNTAAAAVGHAREFSGLGIDIESAKPLEVNTMRLVLRPDELPQDSRTAKLVFSIKEAIYKCIFPLLGQYVDFQEMGVELDTASGRFMARPAPRNWDAESVAGLEGRYTASPDWVMSAAWIARTD